MGRDRSIIGASVGATLPSGLTLSGAWAKGKDMSGMDATASTCQAGRRTRKIGCWDHPGRRGVPVVQAEGADRDTTCNAPSGGPGSDGDCDFGWGAVRIPESGERAQPRAWTDPSCYQTEIGYKFGNSGVAVSWHKSSDFVTEGSKGAALGLGVRHTLPKANTELYAAMQKYGVERAAKRRNTAALKEQDETVFLVGTRVEFRAGLGDPFDGPPPVPGEGFSWGTTTMAGAGPRPTGGGRLPRGRTLGLWTSARNQPLATHRVEGGSQRPRPRTAANGDAHSPSGSASHTRSRRRSRGSSRDSRGFVSGALLADP